MANLHYAKVLVTGATNDNFNNGSIGAPWTESYQTGGSGAEWNHLIITAGEGRITTSSWQPSGIYQSTIDANEAFDVTLHILSHGTIPSTSAGVQLCFYVDSTHYYCLRKTTTLGSSSSGTIYIQQIDTSAPLQLRLTRAASSSSIVGYYRAVGSSWSSIGAQTISASAGQLWVSVNKYTGSSFTATFDHFRNTPTVYNVTVYSDTTGMTHWIGLRSGGSTYYAACGSTGDAKATHLRVRIGGTTYAVWTTKE